MFICNDDSAICVEDFCGTWRGCPINYWAFWYPAEKVVKFGGDWHLVPDMPANTLPTDKQVHEWANKHGE